MEYKAGVVATNFEITAKLAEQYHGAKCIFYSLAFEEGIEDYKNYIGLDENYITNKRKSTVALEAHSLYLKKMDLGSFLVETKICDFDGKRVHIFQEIFREKNLVAFQETLSISFDLISRKTCEFESSIAQRYDELLLTQKGLPVSPLVSLSLEK